MAMGWLLRLLLASLAYFASARLGYALSVQGIAVLWPPSGVMLALLLLTERRGWPVLVLGGVAGSIASDLIQGFPPVSAVAGAFCNLGESFVAALLLTSRNNTPSLFAGLRGLAWFVGGAVLLSNGVTAFLGGWLLNSLNHTPVTQGWLAWWVGDGLGMLVLTPIIVVWNTMRPPRSSLTRSRWIEAAILLAILLTVSVLALGPSLDWLLQPVRYVVFLVLFWIALRFGPIGASTASLIVAGLAIWYAALDVGPFVGNGLPRLRVALELHGYLLVTTLISLIPAVVLEERQAAQRGLLDSESRYRDLFESSPDPSWVYDVATRAIVEVNQAAVAHYGYSRPEFLGMSIFDLRPAHEVPRLLDNLAHIGNDKVRGEYWQHRRKDGSLIYVEISAHSLVFAGRPARLVHAHDVTASRAADAALQAAQERLRQVIASSGAVIFELRRRERSMELDWISENVTRILGYTPDEARLPDWWLGRVHPEDRSRLAGRPALDAYRDGMAEYRLQHRDGRYRWVREEQKVTRDDHGVPLTVVGAWLDITESRQLEQQIQQSQKMEALGHLAGGVAHDFNNILTVLLAEAEQVLEEAERLEPADRASLQEILHSAQRAAALTRQLLTFSRHEIIAPTSLDLNALVRGLEAMLGRLLGENIRIVLRLAPGLDSMLADRGQVEQVCVNLAVNARDAMPDGGTLTIETSNVHLDDAYAAAHAEVVPGDYVMLAVSDMGVGMSEEVKQHLFEPFFTTKPMGRGTGLGLATCYAIVRQAGGHIGVYSEIGLGTTMRVYLPVAREAKRISAPNRLPASQPAGKERILLVEDEVQVRRVTARMLRAFGYQVREVGSAEEAITMLSDGEPVDLLFTDVVLPGMGGNALAERATRIRPGLRIMFASGYSDDIVLQHRLLDQGAVLLQKPFSAETLSQKVRQALGGTA